MFFSTKMFEQIHFYKNKSFKKTYFEYKNGWTVASVRVEKGCKFAGNGGLLGTQDYDNEDSEENKFPRRYYFYKDSSFEPTLIGLHEQPGQSILIYTKPDIWDHEIYDETYLGKIKPRNISTFFNVYDYGLSGSEISIVPDGLAHRRRKVMEMNYEKQIFSTKPSIFEASIFDSGFKEVMKLETMHPVWNEETRMYELDFFGVAKIMSSKNLILCEKGYTKQGDGVGEVKPEQFNDYIYFLQGKKSKTEFNLHYRSPLSDYQAFSISLVSMFKKSFA